MPAIQPDASARSAVLLVNLGTPEAPTARAVRRYLAEFLHDRRVVDVSRWLWCPALHGVILPLRSPRVARNYAKIWIAGRGSPLRVHSEDLAAALARRLPQVRVALAMRYGHPGIAEVLRPLRDAGLRRLLVLPLYPQYSATTTASVFDAVDRELARWEDRPELRCVRDYHLDAGWLDAMAAHIRAQRAQAPGERLLLSFHGIPERYVRRGDPYPRECKASAKAIAQRLRLDPEQWQLGYQSRFGREPWLGPSTADILRDWARQGIARVDVACPGFAVDCLETLDEIAIENAAVFTAKGGVALRYLSALNAEDLHVEALAGLVRRHAAGWAE
ncbi:MAG TPA: ferrochelatase [Xanthomonadaceae bacterium]|jgi:ferrochelatase